jgi:hypothetical protein
MALRSLLRLLVFMPMIVAATEKEILWQDLIPIGWEQESVKINHNEFDFDNSLEQSSVFFAPIVKSLDGQLLSIPGYALPIVYDLTEVKEFLLVPYFGACIHVPAPPSNQVVHVKLQEPIAMAFFAAGPVQVRGKMSIIESTNDFASSGYLLSSATALPY